MWTCPKCHHKFYNTNQSHSCGGHTVDDFLKDKTPHAIDLFAQFMAAYRRIGPFDVHPVKTRVALLTKMRFCSINKVGADHIDVHLVLTEPFPDTNCFFKIDNYADRCFVHHLRIQKVSDITAEVLGFHEAGLRGGGADAHKGATGVSPPSCPNLGAPVLVQGPPILTAPLNPWK